MATHEPLPREVPVTAGKQQPRPWSAFLDAADLGPVAWVLRAVYGVVDDIPSPAAQGEDRGRDPFCSTS